MPKIKYQTIKLSAPSLAVVKQANTILAEYARRNIVVTLRQLYYQFVSRDLIPNKQSEYKRLGSIINDARLAGLIDWNHMQDRTRNLESLPHWDAPGGIIKSAASSYHRDLWDGQENYVEVWVEKDALLSVIERPCNEWDVPFFACRGYTSQSEMWSAGQRLLKHVRNGRKAKIIHLGDHDPSGVDMTRDIENRLRIFIKHHTIRDEFSKHAQGSEESVDDWAERIAEGRDFNSELEVNRIALNIDQVRKYNPPPNPAKLSDSRSTSYVQEHGESSWELDALDPDVLINLIETTIKEYLDEDEFNEKQSQQEREREILTLASDRWEDVAEFLDGN